MEGIGGPAELRELAVPARLRGAATGAATDATALRRGADRAAMVRED